MSGKPDSAYYVRNRGRVSGPHTLDELTRMIRRGLIGRAHEVSTDGATWIAAGKARELFAGPAGPEAAVQPLSSPAPSPGTPMLFYESSGQTFGPMPLALLETLIQNGQLTPDALVWTSDDASRIPAADHPLLAHLRQQRAVGKAGGDHPRKSGSSGCAIMLIGVVALCVAAGVYVSIKLSSSETKTSDEPVPATQPIFAPSSH